MITEIKINGNATMNVDEFKALYTSNLPGQAYLDGTFILKYHTEEIFVAVRYCFDESTHRFFYNFMSLKNGNRLTTTIDNENEFFRFMKKLLDKREAQIYFITDQMDLIELLICFKEQWEG